MRSGDAIVRASWAGTVVFATTATLAVLTDGLRLVGLAVALALFLCGVTAFLAALAIAARRSRTEEIAVGDLFLFQGDAPRRVRVALLGAVVAQSVTAAATAGARPYTSLAFGVLVPVYGLGLAGLWGARFGAYPERQRSRPRRRG